jgi:glycosyltransferase involved in cell wall biosynthesis
MRLLMISSDTAVVQGIHGAFWNTLSGFHRHWERIDIICPYVSSPKILIAYGNVHFYPLPRGKLISPLYVLREGLKITEHLKPHLIVIHAYGMQLMAWGGYWLAQKLGKPFVIEVHHIDGVPKSAGVLDYLRRYMAFSFLKIAYQKARAIRVVNRLELVPLLVSLGIPEEKLRVLYSVYLDRRVFRPIQDIPKQYDIIFVGRLAPNKGLPILLDIFENLKQEIPRARLLIIGRGPLESWLKKRLRAKEGIDYIPFLPSAKDVAEAYNRAKVIVCASSAEGGPRVVVEAMACGLPAVSTPVGLMGELIKDAETGFLVHSSSPQEMAKKIAALLKSDDLYRRCSAKATEVASQFDYDRIIAEYALAYRRLV